MGAKSADALSIITDAARKLNALGDDEVEEIAKNYDPSGSEGSTSEPA